MPNAIILAAGTSSRFVPLSAEIPKGLLMVRGERLIERQINQLHEAGVYDITIVVGYMADKFMYLQQTHGVRIVINEDYGRYNNISSMIRVLDRIGDTFICSSDNYFRRNVFMDRVGESSYYSALYSEGYTGEYCLLTDSCDNIVSVNIGGQKAWYMIGHVYLNKEFGSSFASLAGESYADESVRKGYWEDLYIRHIDRLPKMKIRRYLQGDIEEFDSLDELRKFDRSYIDDTRSEVIKSLAARLNCRQGELTGFRTEDKESGNFLFNYKDRSYHFDSTVDNFRII